MPPFPEGGIVLFCSSVIAGRPRAGGDPYAVPYRKETAYGSRPSLRSAGTTNLPLPRPAIWHIFLAMPLVPLFLRPASYPDRIRIEPATPDEVPTVQRRPGPDGKRSRRPHGDAQVAQVRRLIEQTTLTYSEIAARTGVGRASISRWSRDFNWTRPFDAPRSTDRMPSYRALQRKKLRTLAERLRQLAERHVTELERAPHIDADRLMAALQLLKIARLESQGRRRRRKPLWTDAKTGRQTLDEETAIRTAIRELHRGGVTVDAAPKEAVDMVIDAKLPPLGAAFRERGKRR